MQTNQVGECYTRPWGSYQTLALGVGYQVKILTINPDAQLSLQKHHQRAEHWVVVGGNPTLTLNDSRHTYKVNEYLYIPKEAVHRIENHTDTVCSLVEVQIGDYLGEDDIVRLEDIYGRDS